MMSPSTKALHRRIYRALDAAYCSGAFDRGGSLRGLSAGAIADFMRWGPDLVTHVQQWLKHNDSLIS